MLIFKYDLYQRSKHIVHLAGFVEPPSGLRVLGYARWRRDWMKASSELAHDRRAWGSFVRSVVNSIGGYVQVGSRLPVNTEMVDLP